MAPKTEAELALQRKYEELRKKKEAKLKAKQQQEGAKAEPPKQATAAPAPVSAVPSAIQLSSSPAKKPTVPVKRPAPAPKPAPAAEPEIPGETAKQRAIRLLAAKRAASGGGASPALAAHRKLAATPQAAEKPAAPARQPTIPKRQPAPRPAAEEGQIDDSPADRSGGGAELSAVPKQQEAREGVAAAAQAARQQQQRSVAGGAAKRPAVKRPSSHRPAAPRDDEAGGKRSRIAADGDADGRHGAQPPQNQFQPRQEPGGEADEERRATLFVGDLPPHYDSQAVQDVFSAIAPVDHARVVGTQCYAFVQFRSPADAEYVMQRTREGPLEVEHGRQLRVNWAHGQLPDWKQGSQLVRERGPAPGLDQYEHPKVREARLAAQAAADAFDPEALAEVQLRPPPQRALVVYDDL